MQIVFFLKKRITALLAISLFIGWGTLAFSAPTPSVINYQGFLTNTAGVAQSGSANVTVRIYDAQTAGTLLFEENEGAVTITNGYFSVPVGAVGDVNGTTAAVAITDLAFDKAYYVTVELAAPFNTGEMTLAGGVRSQIGTVPFATVSYGALTNATSSGLLTSKGKMYFNTTDNQLYVYDGTTWNALGIAGSGITTINGLSGLSQFFTVSTAGTDVGITDAGVTHTINIPNAGASARGVVSTTTQTFAGNKTFSGSTTLATTTASNLTTNSLTATGQTTLGNASTSNITTGNFYTTNFFTTSATSTNGFFSSLVATLANFTNVIIGNSTTTNAVTTYLTANSATVGTSTVTGNENIGGTLGVTGQTTLSSASATALTVSGQTVLATASATSLTSNNLNSVNSTSTNSFISSLVATLASFANIIIGNSTTTNAVVTGLTTLATTTASNLTTNDLTSNFATLASSTIAKLRLTGELRDTNNATGTQGQVLATNGTSTYWTTITGTVANGTTNNQTLYWNGSAWTANTNFAVDATGNATTTGNLAVGGQTNLTTLTASGQTTLANASATALTATTLYSTFANLGNATASNLTTNVLTSLTSSLGLASSTALTVSGQTVLTNASATSITSNVLTTNSLTASATSTLFNLFGAGLANCSLSSDKLLWANGTFSCGADAGAGGGVTSLNGSTVAGQSFATTSQNGLTLNITTATSTGVHTFAVSTQAGYTIPLTASTTNWQTFFTSPVSYLTAGTNIVFSGTSTIGLTPNPTFTTGTFSTLISGTSTTGSTTASSLTVSGQTVLATASATSLTATNLYAANSTTTNGFFASLVATLANFTNLIVGNSTTTNAVATYAVTNSSTIGTSTVTGNETIGGTLGVTGTSTLATTSATVLSVSGQTTLVNASATNFSASGALNVTGQTTLGNASTSNITTGNFYTTNFFTTSATSTNGFFSSLVATLANFTNVIIGNSTTTNAVTTYLTANSATVGTSTVTGNENIGGTLGVTGQTTLSSASATALTVSGQTVLATASATSLTATTLYSTLANILNASTTGVSAANLYTTNLFSSLSSLGLASSTALTVSGQTTLATASATSLTTNVLTTNATTTVFNLFGANLSSCNASTDKLMWTNGTFYCGTDAGGAGGTITSLNGSTAATQTLATSTSGGLTLNITTATSTGVHTFALSTDGTHTIPLTASSTQWSSFYNSPISFFNAGNNVLFSGTSTIGLTPNPAFTTGTFSTFISGTSTTGSTTASSLAVLGQTNLTTASATSLTISGQTVLATASATSFTSTNLYSTNSTSTNGFFTSLAATLANFTAAIIGNSTTTNATITNASTTNFIASNATSTNGFFASLVATLANFTNVIIGNSTTTNAVTTYLTANTETVGTSTISGSFTASGLSTLASSTIAKLRLTGELRDTNNATGTQGQVLATNGTSTYWTTITGTVANGTTNNQTLYWNGSAWTANTNFAVDATGNATTTGNLAVGGQTNLTTLTASGQTTLANASATALTATTLYSTLANILNASTTGLTASNLYSSLSSLGNASATSLTTNVLTSLTSSLGNASSTGLTVSGNTYLATTSVTALSIASLAGASLSSCNASTEKLMWANGTFYCGTDAGGAGGSIATLNGSSVSSQSFATSSGSGIDFFVVTSTSTGVHTLSAAPSSGFSIPLTSSTTQWSSFYNSPISFFNAGSNLLFSGTSTIAITSNPTFTTGTFSTLISGTSSLGNASATALTVSGQTVLATASATALTVSGNTVLGSATSSNFFASIFSSLTGFFTNLTTTNATTTYLVANTQTIGTSTITGNQTIAGTLGVGTTSVPSTLSVQGAGTLNPFSVSSSTGASLFSILANGNIGIGTSTPSQALDILGQLKTTSTITSGGSVIANNGGAVLSSTQILFGNAGGLTTFANNSGSSGANTLISGGAAANSSLNIQSTSATGTSDFIKFSTGAQLERVRIDTNGNVGIGSSSPSYLLGVAGTLGVTGQTTLATASSTALTATTLYSTFASLLNASTTGLTATNLFTTNLYLNGALRDGSNATGTLGMVLQTTGTSTQWVATSSLGFASAGVSGGQFGYATRFLSATTLATSSLIDNGSVLGINATSSSYTFNLQGGAGVNPFNIASSTGTSLLLLNQNGNVGIGTDGTGERLEVSGNIISKGLEWTLRTSTTTNQWRSVAYGNGLFVAVSLDGTGNRVMTSLDGITWTSRNSAADNNWQSVVYGNGLFVAVASTGSGNRVMTSPDGITWTSRSLGTFDYYSVTYGKGLFVAVSPSGSIATSPGGITWTNNQPTPGLDTYIAITYGNGLFVGLSDGRIMRSSDGFTWATSSTAVSNSWKSITYGNGLFVAVSATGSGNRVMTSPDGITWTSRNSAANNSWYSVTYGNGLFVAVSLDGTGNRVMTSPDGITWKLRSTSGIDKSYLAVAYGNGTFVTVSASASGQDVMTSGKSDQTITSTNNIYQGGMSVYGAFAVGTSSNSNFPILVASTSGATLLSLSSAGLLSASSSVIANATSTNFFASIFSAVTGFFTNLTATNATTTYLVANTQTIGTSTITSNQTIAGTLGVGTTSVPSTLSVQGSGTTNPFSVASSTGTSLFSVLANGNIGVGNSNPNAKLHVGTSPLLSGVGISTTGILGASAAGDLYPLTVANTATAANNNTSKISFAFGNVWNATAFVGAVIEDSTSAATGLSLGTYNSGLTERVRISSTGNFGIGTSTPTSALFIQNASATQPLLTVASSTGAPLFSILANGNIGIGTSTPASGLVVANGDENLTGTNKLQFGALNTRYIYTDGTDFRWTYSSGKSYFSANGGNALVLEQNQNVGVGTSTASDNFVIQGRGSTSGNPFTVASSTGASLFSILQNGNVGVGTTTVSSFFAVAGSGSTNSIASITRTDTSGTGLIVSRAPSSTGTWTGIRSLYDNSSAYISLPTSSGLLVENTNTNLNSNASIGIRSGSFDTSIAAVYGGSTDTGRLAFGIESVEALSITTIGNVGIGTTSPTSALFIQNASATQPLLTVASSTGAPLFSILANGNIGVGTSTPSRKLTVAGDFSLTGALYDGASVAGTLGQVLLSTGTSTSWVSTSTLGLSSGAGVTGGIAGYATRWLSQTTLGTSTLIDNGTVLGINATSSTVTFNLQGNAGTDLFNIASSTGSSLMLLNQKGNVGIGTDGSGERLEVSGNIISKGLEWTLRTSTTTNQWYSVTYGNGLFVAVGPSGSSTRVMTSPDGVTWTSRTSAADKTWISVTYGNGLFVAVGADADTTGVMTSPDGINWTIRTTPNSLNIASVTYGNGKFVAVGSGGCMTSVDSITWSSCSITGALQGVTYNRGLFVAVGTNAIRTSPDGVTWTTRTSPASNNWYSVTYGNGLFVAVATSGSGNRVMTSPDGITWTARTSAANNSWYSVTYGNGLFVAVSGDGSGNRVMTSPDGITWKTRSTSGIDKTYISIVYGNGTFVAVGADGSGTDVMTSGKADYVSVSNNNIYQGGMSVFGNFQVGTSTNSSASLFVQGTGGINPFTIASSTGASLFSILSNGNVGIGSSTPIAKLSIIGDLNLAQSGTNALIIGNTSGNVRGTNAIDIQSSRSAATQVASGTNATAVGQNNTVTCITGPCVGVGNGNTVGAGYHASAFGSLNTANGNWSTALGYNNSVSGTFDDSVAIGSGNTADYVYDVALGIRNIAGNSGTSAQYASAVGYQNQARGQQSSVFGYQNLVISGANQSSAVGYMNLASNVLSSVFGASSTASGANSTAVGFNNLVSGAYASAFGYNNIASATGSSAFGSYIINNIASSTQIGPSNSAKITILGSGNLGIGTTTPNSTFSLVGTSGFNLFNIASSTGASLFSILQNGYVGIGTSTPVAPLAVSGEVYADFFTAASSTATSTFAGNMNVGSGNLFYNASTTVTSISSLELGNMAFDSDAGIISWVNLPVTTASATGTVESYSAMVGDVSVFTVYGEADGQNSITNPRIGIGTTTPTATLAVQGTGGSSPLLISSSTGSALFSILQNGNVGIGTSTPGYLLGVVGTLGVTGQTTLGNASATSLTVSGPAILSLGSNVFTGQVFGMNPTITPGMAVNHSDGIAYSGTFNAVNDSSNTSVASFIGGVYSNTSSRLYSRYTFLSTSKPNSTWTGSTAHANGDYLGGIGFAGQTDGAGTTGMAIGASIIPQVDGTVSSGVLPTSLTFRTSATSETGLIERLRITSSGNIGIGTTTPSSTLLVQGTTTVNPFTVASSTGTSLFSILPTGSVVIATTTQVSQAKVIIDATLSATTTTTNAVAGIFGAYKFNPIDGGTQFGNRFTVTNAPTTATNTAVGQVIRMTDDTALANTVRALEVTAAVGSNANGINTGIRTTGGTFGVQAFTTGLAGGSATPAALYGENTGTTQGDILRLYTSTMTSAPSMASLYQEISTYTGTGLLMNLGANGGSFTGNFADFQKNGVSQFTVSNGGNVIVNGNITATGTLSILGNTTLINASTTNVTTSGSLFLSSLTPGSIAFISTGGVVTQNNAGLYFDNANTRLGVGTSSPSATLTVQGSASVNPFVISSSTGLALITVTKNGDLGVGTSTPSSRLDVYSSVSATSTDVFRVISDVTSTGNVVFKIKANGDVFTDGATTIGTPADLAEMYPVNVNEGSLPSGTVVAFATSTEDWSYDNGETASSTFAMGTIRKALYGEEALGVVSTRPGILLGGNTTHGAPVAFSGRVPVFVTNENGPVKRGDSLTISSSTPGYAMKATENGFMIGRAISNADESATSTTVLMVVENKQKSLTLSGIDGVAALASSTFATAGTSTVATTLSEKLARGGSVVAEYVSMKMSAVVGYFDTLFAKKIYTNTLCVKKSDGTDVCLTGDQVESMMNASQIPLMNPSASNNQGGASGGSSLPTDGTVLGTSTESLPSNGTSTDGDTTSSSTGIGDTQPPLDILDPTPTGGSTTTP